MKKTISNECIKAIGEIAIKQIEMGDRNGALHSITVLMDLTKEEI